MVRLGIADNARFGVSRVDVDRAGPCYSVDTVRLIREARGSDTEVFFLIGADSLVELPTWHQPERLLQVCHVVAVARPGYRVDWDALERALPQIKLLTYLPDAPVIYVSSTDIRRRVAMGWPIRYLVPAPAERYIVEHALYRELQG
jgi:nicotinate-nucleotide adenylyltransferase